MRPARDLLAALLVCLAATGPARAEDDEAAEKPIKLIVIGTAPVAGTYFPAGGAICNQVNRLREQHGLRCLVESTGGSADNLERLRRGEIDFALVQSDWQYLALRNGHGSHVSRFEDLRAVFALHGQTITVVAHPEAEIAALSDLKGRRIGLGPEESGSRTMAEALIGALGWSHDDFEEVVALDVDRQVEALCGGRIDAFIVPAVHPNGTVALAAARCAARPIDVSGATVDKLVADWPFYAKLTIPGGLYQGLGEEVVSYGPRATLVTRRDVPEATVHALVGAVFEHLDAFTAQHAMLAGLDRTTMVDSVNAADYHEGALRYYRQKGWK